MAYAFVPSRGSAPFAPYALLPPRRSLPMPKNRHLPTRSSRGKIRFFAAVSSSSLCLIRHFCRRSSADLESASTSDCCQSNVTRAVVGSSAGRINRPSEDDIPIIYRSLFSALNTELSDCSTSLRKKKYCSRA